MPQDIADDLKDMINGDKQLKDDFHNGILNAISQAEKDLTEARIMGKTDDETIPSFLNFCRYYLEWVPTSTSGRDEALWMLSVFYFVFDQ